MTETTGAPASQAGLTPQEQRVLDLVDADAVLELTRALIRAPGVNPPGDEGPRAEVLADAARALGLRVEQEEVAAGRPNVRVTLPPAPGPPDVPGLLLLGHTDVVPTGEGWAHDPFAADVVDGRVIGRGSADMLGGLAASVLAMHALARAGVPLSGPVELAALVDEEQGGLGIRHHVAEPTRLRHRACIVAEPTDLRTVVAARGDSYVRIEVRGRSAHAGDPSQGRNAVAGAAHVVREIERWHEDAATRAHPLVGPPTWSVGVLDGGTGASVVPDRCVIEADRRLLPDEDPQQVIADVRETLTRLDLSERGLQVQAEMVMDMPGFETDPQDPLVRVAQDALVAAGAPARPVIGWSAACDGGFVHREAGIPVVVLGPGSVLEQAHRPDESVAVADLVTAARVYALCAMRLLDEGAAPAQPYEEGR